MTNDIEFQALRNRILNQIHTLESDTRERVSKLRDMLRAVDEGAEVLGIAFAGGTRPTEESTGVVVPRGTEANAIRAFLNSHGDEKYTTAQVVDHVCGVLKLMGVEKPRRDIYATVYTFLKRHGDERWAKPSADEAHPE